MKIVAQAHIELELFFKKFPKTKRRDVYDLVAEKYKRKMMTRVVFLAKRAMKNSNINLEELHEIAACLGKCAYTEQWVKLKLFRIKTGL